MTPEERNLIIDLFDRLATLEDTQRDPDAERLIRDDLRQAPNAPYALVQTVLVQDEALKRADERIRELEAGSAIETAARDTSFLGGMRDSLLGRREGGRSVPSLKPAEAGMSPAWQTGAPPIAAGAAPAAGPAAAPMASGGSFLGTTASAAAGVIGGSLLLGGIRSMMGGQHGAQAAFDPKAGATETSPGSGGSAGGDLPREAGSTILGIRRPRPATVAAAAARGSSTTAGATTCKPIKPTTISTTASTSMTATTHELIALERCADIPVGSSSGAARQSTFTMRSRTSTCCDWYKVR